MSTGFRYTRLALALLLLVAPLASSARAADGWDLLKSLAGEWDGATADGKETARITYQVISAGNAVMETMQASADKALMVTMYHRDGDSLMMTHYCAAGNQPRMRAGLQAEGGRLTFRFLDVTNLAGPDAVHMRGLVMTFTGPGQLTQEWTSRKAGKDSTHVFHLKRRQ